MQSISDKGWEIRDRLLNRENLEYSLAVSVSVSNIKSEDVQFPSLYLPACLWGVHEVCYLAGTWFGKEDKFVLLELQENFEYLKDKVKAQKDFL